MSGTQGVACTGLVTFGKIIHPLLQSSIGRSLQVLAIPWDNVADLFMITIMLGSLRSLQHLILFKHSIEIDHDERISYAHSKLLLRLPLTIKSLAFRLTADRLPNHEELSLLNMVLEEPTEVDCLGVAVSGSAGRKLKKVFFSTLNVVPKSWEVSRRILSLHVDDPLNETLPNLEEFIVARHEDWLSLGQYLLQGRLPKLRVVRPITRHDQKPCLYFYPVDWWYNTGRK